MAVRVLRHLEVPALLAVPVALVLGAFAQTDQTALLVLAVAIAAITVFFARFETSKPALRQIMPVVVLAALAAAGRLLFAAIADFKPVSAIAIIAGAVFGRQTGFMVGAIAALVSNLFLGQGPWTPWQMYAWGLVGYFAGILAERGAFERTPLLYAYGFVSPLLYGFLLNTWHIVGFVHPITWETAVLAYAAGIGFDVTHAVATVVFLAILYQPWKKKLERIKRKYGI